MPINILHALSTAVANDSDRQVVKDDFKRWYLNTPRGKADPAFGKAFLTQKRKLAGEEAKVDKRQRTGSSSGDHE